MDCHYFSRTTSGDTAHVIEQNFAAYATENWRLKRIHTPYWAQPLPGTIAPHEKMRWWQLLQFLKTDVDNPESCFIVEGDVVFGPRSFSLLDTLLSSANGGTWDIIATGLSVSSAESILWLCEEKWGMGWER